ncbi:MAG: SpoIIE family protein phosphatase [Syntrophaceae bacterium]|nr:SpoIIE family protein phosphatase [Syntrophaceae bacterium]
MFRNRGIAFKLILFFLLSSGVIFSAVSGYNYWFSRKTIERNVEDNARSIVLSTINRIEAVIRSVQKVPENLACFMEHGSCDKEELLLLLRKVVENNSEIYGGAIAFEPRGFDGEPVAFAPYFYKSKGEILFSDLASESYQYFYWDWYQIPKELDRPDWSEPYYDEGGGNILMATYSVPFYKKGEKRLFRGVVTADLSLEWLQEVVASIRVLQTGYGFLVSKNGMFVTHPLKELIMNATLFGLAEREGDDNLRKIGRRMIRGESGFVSLKGAAFGKPCRMYYAPIPSCGWSLAVVFPEDELMADVSQLNRTVIILGIAGIALLVIAVVYIARSITRPLREMARATGAIATGNLDVELPRSRSGDETGELLDAFRYMKESLKDYIRKLTETIASKERIESELKIAHDIQMSILPKIFPPFPDRKEFDIYAIIEPAREVGGDFYDFFFIDEENLFFIIGDVSGKGIPASLFMAVAKTLIKATAMKGIAPGEILTEVNRELSQGNDSCMFATIFCGILNTRTGLVLYSNGGHNPPFLLGRNNEVTPLKMGKGVVVGAWEGLAYQTEQIRLKPGDGLYLYTDGVPEAINEQGEFFSAEQLRRKIGEFHGASIQEMTVGIMKEILSFSHGAPQSDDITMMMIRFIEKSKSLS